MSKKQKIVVKDIEITDEEHYKKVSKPNNLFVSVIKRGYALETSSGQTSWTKVFQIDFQDESPSYDFVDTEFSLDLSMDSVRTLLTVLLRDSELRQIAKKLLNDKETFFLE